MRKTKMSLNCAADLSELESLLAEHMHPSGVSRELHAELETARRLRDEEATRFAQSRQLEEALEELLQEDSVPGAGKALAALHSLLSRARAAQYLREDGVVLGVDPPAVLSSAHREERALVQRLVVPLLEQRTQRSRASFALRFRLHAPSAWRRATAALRRPSTAGSASSAPPRPKPSERL